MGRAAVRGTAARGAWAKSIKSQLSRSYRERSAEPITHKKTSTASTEIQAMTAIGVLGGRVRVPAGFRAGRITRKSAY